MPITARSQTEDGQPVGWDSDQRRWVAIDETAEQGSFLGNIGRAASTEMQSIGQGIAELTQPDSDYLRQHGALLQAQQQAQQRAAPWATGIGSVVPDVAAGLAAAPLTGGLSLPGMLAAEAGVGALTGALRPGSAESRIGNAALGAASVVGGLALGHVAAAGVGGALKIFGQLEGRTLGRIADTADLATERARIARQPVEAAPIEGEAMPGGASVGAAETPAGVARGLTPEQQMTEEALQRTEQVGAGAEARGGEGFTSRLDEMVSEGYTPTIGQGTRAFSPARLSQAYRELGPMGDFFEQRAKAGNQAMMGRYAARAVGDPNWETVGRVDVDWLAQQEARLGEEFRMVEGRLPQVDPKTYQAALESLRPQVRGPSGSLAGQKDINSTIEALKGWKGNITSEEVMAERRVLSQKVADYYRMGDTDSGELVMRALGKLDDVLEREIKQNKYKTGLLEKWQEARSQWQVLKQLQAGASLSKTGDVNAATLMNRMKRARASGGFGPGGPDRVTPAGKLYSMAVVMADAETGVPMTGARALMGQVSRKGTGLIGSGMGLNLGMGLFGD